MLQEAKYTCMFTYGLFNDAVSGSGYIALNDWLKNNE
jgi:hypothetical protein